MEAPLICQVHLSSTTLQPGTIVQYTEHGKGSVKLTDYSDVVLPRTLLGLSAAYSSPMNIDSNAQLANARAVLSHGWPAIVNRAVVDGARLHAAMGWSSLIWWNRRRVFVRLQPSETTLPTHRALLQFCVSASRCRTRRKSKTSGWPVRSVAVSREILACHATATFRVGWTLRP